MAQGSLNLPFISIPLAWVKLLAVAPVRYWAGTHGLAKSMANMERHVLAMTEVLHIMAADMSGGWNADQRERVQRVMTGFTLVEQGLQGFGPRGNPITDADISKLREFNKMIHQGQVLTPEEATEHKRLAEVLVKEHPEKERGTQLLASALMAFMLFTKPGAVRESPVDYSTLDKADTENNQVQQ